MLKQRCTDELDILIPRVLRESVAGATPSPEVWERITERAEREDVPPQTRWSLGSLLEDVAVWLSADTYPPPVATPPVPRVDATMQRYGPSWSPSLLNHYLRVTRMIF
jgi:hypothetical protein